MVQSNYLLSWVVVCWSERRCSNSRSGPVSWPDAALFQWKDTLLSQLSIVGYTQSNACTQMRCVKLLNPKIMHIYFSTWILSLNIFLLHWIPLVPSPINCLSYQESQNVTMFLPMQLPCHLSNNPLPSNHFILTHLLSRFHHLYQLPTLWKQTKIYFIKH